MGGLNAALSVAAGALSAQEAAIEVVNNNIANATTPGYDREVVDLSAAASTPTDGVEIGDGVQVNGVTSVRDQLLNLQIQQQTSEQTAASAQSGVLGSVQPYFSTSGTTVGTSMSSFFTSLSALSSAPSNSADRQTVISNAQALVQQFNATSAGLSSTQTGLSTQISGDVTEINTLASQIAALNAQIGPGTGTGQGDSSLVDQRSALEQQLSGLTQIAITTTNEGDTVTTGSGTALVAGSESFALSLSAGSDGLVQVLDSEGDNVTASLTGGDLGGMLEARDVNVPSYLNQLDSLANGFANAINAAQASGFDLNGDPGQPLFTIPATVSGSAASIALATTSGSAVAASSVGTPSGSPGSNGNLAALTGVQTAALAGGLSPTGSFAALVDSVGNDASEASSQSTAIQASLTQLTTQQSAVSGVSIDEESTNLIQYQQAYEAAAEVVTTINSLFSTTLNMVSETGGA